jgi:hypothetical protein
MTFVPLVECLVVCREIAQRRSAMLPMVATTSSTWPGSSWVIRVEVAYRRNQMQHKEYNSNSGFPNLIGEDDPFWYRLRISREF